MEDNDLVMLIIDCSSHSIVTFLNLGPLGKLSKSSTTWSTARPSGFDNRTTRVCSWHQSG